MKRIAIGIILLLIPIITSIDAHLNVDTQPEHARMQNYLQGLIACYNNDHIFLFVDDSTYAWIKCTRGPNQQLRRK